MLFTLIESILENVHDVVCLSFLSNEGDTDIFYKNYNDTIETFIYFAMMEDKTILDKKHFLSFFNRRAVGIFKVLSITKFENIF